MTVNRLDELLVRLGHHGYEVVEEDDEQAVVRRAGDGATFVLTGTDTWVSAMQLLLEADAIADSGRAEAVHRFAMELHSRYLGCRFGFDDERNLCVQYDVYPDMSAEHVATALAQVAYVAASAAPLFEVVLAGGVVDDKLIERGFGAIDDDTADN